MNDGYSTLRVFKKAFPFVFQNGYPSRRRSLVDDARFETLVVKQTKQNVLEEARQKANGKFFILFCKYTYLVAYDSS